MFSDKEFIQSKNIKVFERRFLGKSRNIQGYLGDHFYALESFMLSRLNQGPFKLLNVS